MEFFYQRSYRGPVKAVVLDLEGTSIDHGGLGLAKALIELFQRYQVSLPMDRAHTPHALLKEVHLQRLFQTPSIAEQWRKQHQSLPDGAKLQSLVDELQQIQLSHTTQTAQLLPGVASSVQKWQQAGILISAVSSETEVITQAHIQHAATQGFQPDCAISIDQIPSTQPTAPAPWLIAQSAMLLEVYPWESIVSIGDTVDDIEAGLNAGVWTVGIVQTGREMGLTAQEFQAMPSEQRQDLIAEIKHRMYRSGAHFVVNTFDQCNIVLDEIQDRLAIGIRPA
ncbi:MAG: phosphonoacetaldehyde hydrolase [Myxococcales bacterium]|nr:phosphonoacetaldehyde hydrolase [Myxococcales bacterium]